LTCRRKVARGLGRPEVNTRTVIRDQWPKCMYSGGRSSENASVSNDKLLGANRAQLVWQGGGKVARKKGGFRMI